MSVNHQGSSREFAGPALPPPAQGLYDPKREHDACGVGFVADMKGGRVAPDRRARPADPRESRPIAAPSAPTRLSATAPACWSRSRTSSSRVSAQRCGIDLPPPGHYAVGHCVHAAGRGAAQPLRVASSSASIEAEGQQLLGWRDVPTDNTGLGQSRDRDASRAIGRCSSAAAPTIEDERRFERKLYILRKVISGHASTASTGGTRHRLLHACRCPARTLVYKGMLLAYQVGAYYQRPARPALRVGAGAGAPALLDQHLPVVGARAPLPLGRPQRRDQHGARQRQLDGGAPGERRPRRCSATTSRQAVADHPTTASPTPPASTTRSSCWCRAATRSPHAMMMLIPEAWAGNPLMDAERRAFYEYHAALMEPWDGPAAMAFTDGRQIGATLDRNGLRPARYIVTDDDLVIMASEAGVLPIPEEKIVAQVAPAARQDAADRPRAGPHHRRRGDQARARQRAALRSSGSSAPQIKLRGAAEPVEPRAAAQPTCALLDRQQAFGYTQEDIKFLLAPMAQTGEEAVGSMGTDTPLAVLSDQAEAALQLFQAELRAGHQPADRPDPRGAGDVAGVVHRAAAEPARPRRHVQAEAAGSARSRS